jgi:hypothetical protein
MISVSSTAHTFGDEAGWKEGRERGGFWQGRPPPLAAAKGSWLAAATIHIQGTPCLLLRPTDKQQKAKVSAKCTAGAFDPTLGAPGCAPRHHMRILARCLWILLLTLPNRKDGEQGSPCSASALRCSHPVQQGKVVRKGTEGRRRSGSVFRSDVCN